MGKKDRTFEVSMPEEARILSVVAFDNFIRVIDKAFMLYKHT